MARPHGTIRPNQWISGPDPVRHSKYIPWLRARGQARFRGEEYPMTFEEFCDLWTDQLWSQRGRGSESLGMTRRDLDGPWTVENCVIVTRREQVAAANRWRTERKNNERNTGKTQQRG